ncbi:MAG: bacteriocin system secretion protein [Herminiimonas sp.]|nr:bacteriocin system secretion protein [Herminiimonas sp.]
MSNGLFRKSALQSLSSPEQLDQLVRIPQPGTWVALIASCLVLLAAVVWSVYGVLPTSLSGQGILIRNGGVFDIHAFGDGIVTELPRFKVGDRIRKGQVLGKIPQPELEQQVASQEQNAGRMALEEIDAAGRAAALAPAQDRLLNLQAEAQQKIIKSTQGQLRSLRTVERAEMALLRNGTIARQRFEQTRRQILAIEEEINMARVMLQKLSVNRIETAMQRDSALREARTRLTQAHDRLNALRLEHQLAANVVSTHDGIVVEMMAMQGDAVKKGQSILSVEVDDSVLEAMIYLPPQSNAKLIKPGMVAQISPATSKKERFGYLIGSVSAIAQFPATEKGMRATFDNAVLIREMNKSGPPVAVQVELVRDTATTSGYKWSSRSGASVALSSGTLVTGTFVVETKRPISLIIPLFREALGL